MNNLYGLLFITFIFIQATLFAQAKEYEQSIQQNAEQWKMSHISEQQSLEEIQTIIDLLALSYQVAQESCNMILAKFTAQEEILKFYTPSLTDSWHENLQIEHNDYQKLDDAVNQMKASQKVFQSLYHQARKLIPRLIDINPQITQTLINDLKNSLISWGKEQEEITNQLVFVQDEFEHAIATISDIKTIFQKVFVSSELKHSDLKQAASFFSKTYKDIEHVIDHLTKVRKESIIQIKQFCTIFFKSYYKTIFNELPEEQKACITDAVFV